MKHIIENKQEEQIMILMVALKYQLSHHIENDYKKSNFIEDLAKSLFNIQFDAYDIAAEIEEDSIFEYIDESWTYEQMVKEKAVKIFRDAIKKHNFEVQSDD